MEPRLRELHTELTELIAEVDYIVGEILRDGTTHGRMVDLRDKRKCVNECLRDVYKAAGVHLTPDPVDPDPDGDRKADR